MLRLSLDNPDASQIGELLGAAIAPIASVLNLSEIVISAPGPISNQELLDSVMNQIQSATLPEIHQGLVVRFTKLGGDVVLLGAAALALSAVLGVA